MLAYFEAYFKPYKHIQQQCETVLFLYKYLKPTINFKEE